MRDFLVLKLEGLLQAWGRETFEGLRPSELYPGRSALLGMLGACLGIERNDSAGQNQLAASINFAVRIDQQCQKKGQKMTDYHTVKNARVDYQSLKSHDTIQTWREYWQDAKYTVLVWNAKDAKITLMDIKRAIEKPLYTPVLGRRSCALSRPLFETEISAASVIDAFSQLEPVGGSVYSDGHVPGTIPLKKRDIPIINQPRQFASRMVYMAKGEVDVSQ